MTDPYGEGTFDLNLFQSVIHIVLLPGTTPSQGVVIQFHRFQFLELEDLYRFGLRAERDPLLEYGNGMAHRTHPAGLIGDRGTLWQRSN